MLGLVALLIALANATGNRKKCADHLVSNTVGLNPVQESSYYPSDHPPKLVSVHYRGYFCVLVCKYKLNDAKTGVDYDRGYIKCAWRKKW